MLLTAAVLLLLANLVQWRTNRRAAAAVRATAGNVQADALNRPWISIESAIPGGSALSYARNGPSGAPGVKIANDSGEGPDSVWLSVDLHYRNIGRSPARGVRIIPELYLTTWNDGYSARVAAESARFCDAVSSESQAAASTGQEREVLFPGDRSHQVFHTPAILAPGTLTRLASQPGQYILPVLIGCVGYQYPTSSQLHRTRFVYELLHTQQVSLASVTRFFGVDQPVLPRDLMLMRNEGDDFGD